MVLILSAAFLVMVGLLCAAAFSLRRAIGYRRLILIPIQLVLLIPWLIHYLSFLRMAGSQEFPGLTFAAPFLMLLVILFVQIDVTVAKIGNPLVPGLAFLQTYYLVMPVVYSAVPDYKFDNIPTIWLFAWTVGVTLILFSYTLQATVKVVAR